jgi:hypothetical protein
VVLVTSGSDRRVQLSDTVNINIPPELSPVNAQGVDTAVRIWSGGGITVLVDLGPMSDRLDRYEGSQVELSGRAARVAAFDDAADHVIAVHLDDPALTISVRFERTEQESVAHRIIESLSVED